MRVAECEHILYYRTATGRVNSSDGVYSPRNEMSTRTLASRRRARDNRVTAVHEEGLIPLVQDVSHSLHGYAQGG